MCGIVGALTAEITVRSHPVNDFFKQALFMDTIRGFDSTGMFLVGDEDKSPEIYKKALAAPDFLQLATPSKLLSNTNDWDIMIGHNRAATKGGIKHHTAHPFKHGPITLVHNGTIYNHRGLPEGNNFEVDSEAITNAIAVGGVDIISEIDGAFTLVWYNEDEETLNMIRNEERPFSFGKVKDHNTILMASEANMLQWLAIRNNMPLEGIVTPKPGELFTWNIKKHGKKFHKKVSVKEVKLRKKTVWVGGYPTGTGKTTTGYSTYCSSGPSARIKNALETLGFSYKEEVFIKDPKFEKYNTGSNYGKIVGHLNDTNVKAEINGVSVNDWAIYDEGDEVLATINGIRENGLNHRNATIILDSKDFAFCTPDPNENKGGTLPALLDENSNTVELVKGPNKEMIPLKEFEELVKHGCGQCAGDILPEDADKIGWLADNTPICKDCISACGYEDYLN